MSSVAVYTALTPSPESDIFESISTRIVNHTLDSEPALSDSLSLIQQRKKRRHLEQLINKLEIDRKLCEQQQCIQLAQQATQTIEQIVTFNKQQKNKIKEKCLNNIEHTLLQNNNEQLNQFNNYWDYHLQSLINEMQSIRKEMQQAHQDQFMDLQTIKICSASCKLDSTRKNLTLQTLKYQMQQLINHKEYVQASTVKKRLQKQTKLNIIKHQREEALRRERAKKRMKQRQKKEMDSLQQRLKRMFDEQVQKRNKQLDRLAKSINKKQVVNYFEILSSQISKFLQMPQMEAEVKIILDNKNC